MAIIDALASGNELTATECAALTGLSPSATAYHLKTLERYGFAEPAATRGDARERPWRATNRRTTFELDSSTPAGSEATAAVALAYLDSSRAVAAEFMVTEHEEPAPWQGAAFLGNSDLWLTVEETNEITTSLAAILTPYRKRTRATRPDGSRRVRVMNVVVPHHVT